MSANKYSIWIVGGYGIILIILLYVGLDGLIMTAISDTFPNGKFIAIMITVMIVSWSVGLAVRRYVKSFSPKRQNQLTASFLCITVLSWIIVLVLFTITDFMYFI